MKHYVTFSIAAAFAAVLLLAPSTTEGQDFKIKAASKAQPLTLFDREGKVLKILGEPAVYSQPSFSPDRSRIAVIRSSGNAPADLWVLDVETGAATRITQSRVLESPRSAVWSPDGRYLAYVATRERISGIYRTPADGQGAEDLLHPLPVPITILMDWSLDGKYLYYYSPQLGESTLFALPLEGNRTPVARLRAQFTDPRLSPDGKLVAYRSSETGRDEIWVSALHSTSLNATQRWQVSDQGGLGMVRWRRDSRELYYFAADRGIMAVPVSTSPVMEFGKPRLLFKAPNTIDIGPAAQPGASGAMSLDGERMVFALPPEPELHQLTMYDRSGKVIRAIGEPGLVAQPAFSPDGQKLAYLRNDMATGTVGIWTVDLETGKTTQVASDRFQKTAPTWSPDGSYIAYQSNRGTYTSIYWRKADGTGDEEMLFRFTAGSIAVLFTDFSPDGQHVLFNDGGYLGAARLTGADPLARNVIEMLREEYAVGFARISPDGRYIAYNSTESGNRIEMFVRPFDAVSAILAEQGKVQVTKDGLSGVKVWRADGKELFFLQSQPRSDEIQVMAVDITTGPEIQAGAPRKLFALKQATAGTTKFVSPDGEHFVFVVRR